MVRSGGRRAWVLGMGMALLGLNCKGTTTGPAPAPSSSVAASKPARTSVAIALSFQPSPAEREGVRQLTSAVLSNRKLPEATRRDRSRVREILLLAAGSDEAGAAAGLDAIADNEAVCSDHAKDCETLIVARLVDVTPLLRFRAATAARSVVAGRNGSDAVKKRVVESLLTEVEPGVAYALALALQDARFGSADAALVDKLLEHARAGNAELRAAACLALLRLPLTNPNVRAVVTSLSADAVPVVRAAAAQLLGALGGVESAEILAKLAGDEAPCVRGSAALGLASARLRSSMDELLPLLDDTASPVCVLEGFIAADRTPGRLVLPLPAESQVRQTALAAIATLAGADSELANAVRDPSGANIDANIKTVRAFVAKDRRQPRAVR